MLERKYSARTGKCNMKEFPGRFMTLRVVSFLFMVTLVRFNCAPIRRVEHLRRPEGCDLRLEDLWAWTQLLHVFVDASFHQLVPHWPPTSCVLLSMGRLGPAHTEVGLGFAVGWFRRYRRDFLGTFTFPTIASPAFNYHHEDAQQAQFCDTWIAAAPTAHARPLFGLFLHKDPVLLPKPDSKQCLFSVQRL